MSSEHIGVVLSMVTVQMPMTQARQAGQRVRVAAFDAAVQAVLANPGARESIIEQHSASAVHESDAARVTFRSELSTVTHPMVAPVYFKAKDLAEKVLAAAKGGTSQEKAHSLSQALQKVTSAIRRERGMRTPEAAFAAVERRWESQGRLKPLKK